MSMLGFGRLWIAIAMIVVACSNGAGQTVQRPSERHSFDWKAFHRKNDEQWALRTKLSSADVRRLRLTAGVADDEPSDPIDLIDAKRLSRGHILFVTAAGSGHCLDVRVYVWHRGFRELWSQSETPDGQGFCHPSLCRNPVVRATKKGEITVTVPQQTAEAPMGLCEESIVLVYRWTGTIYELAEQRTVSMWCGDAYFAALDVAFSRWTKSAEVLAMIEIAPAFWPESAIVFERASETLNVTRIALPQKLFAYMQPSWVELTAADCMQQAKSASINPESTDLAIASGEAQQFLAELASIDTRTDHCTRARNGTCAYPLDATYFIVYLPDGTMRKLTALGESSEIVSENPALLSWVTKVLQRLKQAD